MPAGAFGWGRSLMRATLIGTVLQLSMVVLGHYDPRVAKLFAPLGMFLSFVAGLVGRWSLPLAMRGAVIGGAVAGGVCALIGIAESFTLGDVASWVIAFGTASSAATGAVGGWLGRFSRRR